MGGSRRVCKLLRCVRKRSQIILREGTRSSGEKGEDRCWSHVRRSHAQQAREDRLEARLCEWETAVPANRGLDKSSRGSARLPPHEGLCGNQWEVSVRKGA